MLIYKITSKCSRGLKPPEIDLKGIDLGAEKEGKQKIVFFHQHFQYPKEERTEF